MPIEVKGLVDQIQFLQEENLKKKKIMDMILHYWTQKSYFSQELLFEALEYVSKEKNPFLYIKEKMEAELDEMKAHYSLSSEVFEIQLENDKKLDRLGSVEVRVGDLGYGGSYPIYSPNTTIKEVLENEPKHLRHTVMLWKDWTKFNKWKNIGFYKSQIPLKELYLLNHPVEFTLKMIISAIVDIHGVPILQEKD